MGSNPEEIAVVSEANADAISQSRSEDVYMVSIAESPPEEILSFIESNSDKIPIDSGETNTVVGKNMDGEIF